MIYSELELLVMEDMVDRGYDPQNKWDVLEYWSFRLND